MWQTAQVHTVLGKKKNAAFRDQSQFLSVEGKLSGASSVNTVFSSLLILHILETIKLLNNE